MPGRGRILNLQGLRIRGIETSGELSFDPASPDIHDSRLLGQSEEAFSFEKVAAVEQLSLSRQGLH